MAAAVLALDLQSWQSTPLPVAIDSLKRQNLALRVYSSTGGDATQHHARSHNQRQQHTRPAVAVRSVQGRRPYQEDSFCVVTDLLGAAASVPPAQEPEALEVSGVANAPQLHFAAVFDGHGGSAVAQHCTERLASILRTRLLRTLRMPHSLLQSDSSSDSFPDMQMFGEQQLQLPDETPEQPLAQQHASCAAAEVPEPAGMLSDQDATQCLLRSFADCDASIPEAASAEGGSTAVCALLGADNLWVANCGDSRAVIARRGALAVPLTDDHKPERPDEAARVKAAGGHVFWNGGHRVMGVLSMSRAMGDQYLKQYGVISTPEITCTQRTPDDEFLLLASDGLWVSLSNAEAVGVVAACLERAQARGADRQAALRVAAQVLVKAALQQGSSDNITVVLMDLQGLAAGVQVTAHGDAAVQLQGATGPAQVQGDTTSAPPAVRENAAPAEAVEVSVSNVQAAHKQESSAFCTTTPVVRRPHKPGTASPPHEPVIYNSNSPGDMTPRQEGSPNSLSTEKNSPAAASNCASHISFSPSVRPSPPRELEHFQLLQLSNAHQQPQQPQPAHTVLSRAASAPRRNATAPPPPVRTGSKRSSGMEEVDGEQGEQEVASPTKRSRLFKQSKSHSFPRPAHRLDLRTERLLVSVPSPGPAASDS